MLSNFLDYVKRYRNEILIAIIIVLVSLLSFAAGYIVAKYQAQQDIRFIQNSNS